MSGSNGVGGLIGSLINGARASGGPVQAGKTYLVGENGPEMVRFGKNGAVTPNAVVGRAGSAAPVSVTVIDRNDSKVGVQEQRGPGGARQLEIIIESAIVKSIDRNGDVAQILQGRYGLNRTGGRR